MLIYFLLFIAGFLIGFIPTYIYCWKKPKAEIIEKNLEMQQYNDELWQRTNELSIKVSALSARKNDLIDENLKLKQQKEEYQLDIDKIKSDTEKTTNLLINQANENFERQIEKLGAEYQESSSEYQQEYKTMMSELVANYAEQLSQLEATKEKTIADNEQIIAQLQNELLDLRHRVDAATEVQKRAELERTEKDFYRLILPKADIDEIKQLRTVKMRDITVLNKVIWKVYYEKPYTDLIGRVVGQGKKTGIYKITNLENGMSYVGQAVDIAERWRQHIKRGLGAETPTKNKLYPAMMEFGVENFTFEIIEECERSQLDEKEDYYQDFYHTKDFGYSIK